MTIRREQSVGDHEAGAGNAGAELRLPAGKSHVVDAEDVANGIAVAVQDEGGHGLLLLELLHFVSELLNLAFEVSFLGAIPLKIVGLRGGVVTDHRSHAHEEAHSQYAFE